jgi:hypothetical protein
MVVTIFQNICSEGRPCHQVVAPGLLSWRWSQGTVYGRILVAAMIVWGCGGDGWKTKCCNRELRQDDTTLVFWIKIFYILYILLILRCTVVRE